MATGVVVMETIATLEKLKKPVEVEFQPSEVEVGKPGVWCIKHIKQDELYGPYSGQIILPGKHGQINYRYAWEVFNPVTNSVKQIVDATDPMYGNWMRYVNCARYFEEQNIVSVQIKDEIYYKAIKDIEVGDELLTWFDLNARVNFPSKKNLQKKQKQNETKSLSSTKSVKSSKEESSESPKRKIQPCITASLLQKKSTPQKRKVTTEIEVPKMTQKKKEMQTTMPFKIRKKSSKNCSSTGTSLSNVQLAGTVMQLTSDLKPSPQNNKHRTSTPINSSKTFLFHIEKKHQVIRDEKKMYACELCKMMYQKPFSLKRHFLRTHINCQYLTEKDLVNCCINAHQQSQQILCAQNLQNSGLNILTGKVQPPNTSPSKFIPNNGKSGKSGEVTRRKKCENITSSECNILLGLYKCDVCYFTFNEVSELVAHTICDHPSKDVSKTQTRGKVKSKLASAKCTKLSKQTNKKDTKNGQKHLSKMLASSVCETQKAKEGAVGYNSHKNPAENILAEDNLKTKSTSKTERKRKKKLSTKNMYKTKAEKALSTFLNDKSQEVILRKSPVKKSANIAKSQKSQTMIPPGGNSAKKSPQKVSSSISNPRKTSPVKTSSSPRSSPRLAGNSGPRKTPIKQTKPRGNKYIKQKYKNFPCTLCKVRFTRVDNLEKHLKDHQENKSFPCYFCGKKFMNETKMKQHVRYHFGQNVSCRHCCERFPNVGDMRQHLMIAHEEEWRIKQSEEEEEKNLTKKKKQSMRRRKTKVQVISEKDYRSVLSNKTMIQTTIYDSLGSSSPKQSMKVLTSPIARRKSQEEPENEPAANGYKSKYRYSCFTCKKRFISYHSLAQHRKTNHRYDRYAAPSALLHMKQKVSEEKFPLGVLPMLSAPVSPNPYYSTVAENVTTNLTSYLDGNACSLKNFKKHVQILGYNSINSVSPLKNENLYWQNYNFPFHYEPYESVIGYNNSNQGPIIPEEESSTFDAAKQSCISKSGQSKKSRKFKIFDELNVDITSDEPPVLQCMADSLLKQNPVRRLSEESDNNSMPSLTPSLTPSFEEIADSKFFQNMESSVCKDAKKTNEDNLKRNTVHASCKYDDSEILTREDNSIDQDRENLTNKELNCIDKKESPAALPVISLISNIKSSAFHLQPDFDKNVLGNSKDGNLGPDHIKVQSVISNDDTSHVPLLDALNLVKASECTQIMSSIRAANKNIPAHIFEKDIQKLLSTQKWDRFSDNFAFGKLGDVTNVCSVCHRYFDTVEHLVRHQWTKHSSMQYRHLQIEKGKGIDSLFYTWPSNEGLVAASTPVPEDCHSLPAYKCTRCKSSFKNISRLHVHIISCDPRKLFYVERVSQKERRKIEEKERKKQAKLKVKEEEDRGKKRNLIRLSQSKSQLAQRRKVKKLLKSKKEEKSPVKLAVKLTSSTSPFTNLSPRSLREARRNKSELSSMSDGRLTRQRKRRNYELLYKPDNHVRRREMTDIVESHQCSGCTLKFRTLFLLERHARKCSEKEKLRSTSSNKDTNKTSQQHNCQYCGRKFTYLKSLSNHYIDFCPVKKEKQNAGELKQEEVDTEKVLRVESVFLEGSKKDKTKDKTGETDENDGSKKRCGWPRGMKRKNRRKNHSWTYTKRKKNLNIDSSDVDEDNRIRTVDKNEGEGEHYLDLDDIHKGYEGDKQDKLDCNVSYNTTNQVDCDAEVKSEQNPENEDPEVCRSSSVLVLIDRDEQFERQRENDDAKLKLAISSINDHSITNPSSESIEQLSQEESLKSHATGQEFCGQESFKKSEYCKAKTGKTLEVLLTKNNNVKNIVKTVEKDETTDNGEDILMTAVQNSALGTNVDLLSKHSHSSVQTLVACAIKATKDSQAAITVNTNHTAIEVHTQTQLDDDSQPPIASFMKTNEKESKPLRLLSDYISNSEILATHSLVTPFLLKLTETNTLCQEIVPDKNLVVAAEQLNSGIDIIDDKKSLCINGSDKKGLTHLDVCSERTKISNDSNIPADFTQKNPSINTSSKNVLGTSQPLIDDSKKDNYNSEDKQHEGVTIKNPVNLLPLPKPLDVSSDNDTDNENTFYNMDTETDTDFNYNAETETDNDMDKTDKKQLNEGIIGQDKSQPLETPYTENYFTFNKVSDFNFSERTIEDIPLSHTVSDDKDAHSSTVTNGNNNGCYTAIVDVTPDSDVSR